MIACLSISRRRLLAAALALPAAALVAHPAAAQTPEIYAEGGVAIGGTDPVAYFTQGRPVRGERGHALMWHGVEWHFSSEETRAAFEADPVRFAPQYGGWCAWAVAEGYTASSTPDAWAIVDGKLYLNYSRGIQRRWERDIPGNIDRADANWPAIRAR
jgi:YHS domain-containing protein